MNINNIYIAAKNYSYSKQLVSSFLRNHATFNIVIHNFTSRTFFTIEKKGVEEIVTELDSKFSNYPHYYEFENITKNTTSKVWVNISQSALCLRNPDHLWMNCQDVLNMQSNLQYMEDRKERLRDSSLAALLTKNELAAYSYRYISSPGIFSIQSKYLPRLTEVWKQAHELGKDIDESIREKAVWNKTLVMLAGEMKQKPFERGEVIPVREGEIDWDEVRNACIVSVSDWKDEKAKEHFLRCLYFGHFFGDESGLMLNILDP